MKVAIVHTDFRLYWPARLEALSSSLSGEGFSLTIVEIAGLGSPYYFSGRETNKLDWRCIFPDKRIEDVKPSVAKQSVIDLLDKIDPSIVIAGPIAFTSGAASVFWAVKNRKKVIIFDDARIEDVPRPWWVNHIKSKIYSCVDAVFCPAPEWRLTFSKFRVPAEKIFYGVDVVNNNYWSEDIGNLESPVPGKKFLLAVGRQVPKKNFALLLKAYYQYISNTTSQYDLVLVGEGPEHETLVNYVKKYGFQDRVHFFPFSAPEKLREFYHFASWFILPSGYGESWGLVVNEAMASGLPVLISNHSGCANTLVSEGLNGFIFSPERNILVKMLNRLDSIDDAQRACMGFRSKEIIAGWGLDKFCAGVSEAISYVASSKAATSGILTRIILYSWKGRYRPV